MMTWNFAIHLDLEEQFTKLVKLLCDVHAVLEFLL